MSFTSTTESRPKRADDVKPQKASKQLGFMYPEALDVALCHGRIGGQIQGENEDYFLQAFTPRRTNSLWAKINREHVNRTQTW